MTTYKRYELKIRTTNTDDRIIVLVRAISRQSAIQSALLHLARYDVETQVTRIRVREIT